MPDPNDTSLNRRRSEKMDAKGGRKMQRSLLQPNGAWRYDGTTQRRKGGGVGASWGAACLVLILLCDPSSPYLGAASRHVPFNESARWRMRTDPPGADPPGAFYIACAMNSVEFLRELCNRKNTGKVTFYKSFPHQNHAATHVPLLSTVGAVGSRDSVPCDAEAASLDSAHIHSTSCEYRGKLWFRKRGINFRETITVGSVRPCGSEASVECKTEYHNGKKWVDCAKVICDIQTGEAVEMKVKSSILVRVPMVPKVGLTAVNHKISSTFHSAASAFVNELKGSKDI